MYKMNQFMMDAIQRSGSDYSQKQDMLNNQFTSDQMLANRQKQVYNTAVSAAKGRVNTLIGSDYAETAYYGLDFAKKAYKQYKTAQAQVAELLELTEPLRNAHWDGLPRHATEDELGEDWQSGQAVRKRCQQPAAVEGHL